MTADPARTPPLCPVSGAPAVRFVQRVSTAFLARLWEIEFKVDARPSFRGISGFDLWVSPTGLYFFDPPYEGDAGFYTSFYTGLLGRGLWRSDSVREEFVQAARHISEGDRVLDFGCGFGPFRLAVPQARYTGLDPHFSGDSEAATWVRAETLEHHLATHAGAYDVACAFQVLEHVAAPLDTFRRLSETVRPGGLVIIGVPHVPSLMTEIPNYLINAPPHHMTWWTEAALAALTERSGLDVESIERVPWGKVDSLAYWWARCCPIKARDIHYRHHWTWHASAAIGIVGAFVMSKIVGVPRRNNDGRDEDGRGGALLLVARKSAQEGGTSL